MKIVNFIKNNAREILFYGFILFSVSVLFETTYVPTLDGGPHAYNARILSSLLFSDGGIYADVFKINPEPVPNWFAGVLLMIFNSFLSVEAAEKLILFIYFVSFPLLFKVVVDRISGAKSYFVFLVFPISHFALIYYGFFNFAYGILFFLVGMNFWIKNSRQLTIKKLFLFAAICLLIYFTHIFSFLSLLIFCALYEGYDFVFAIWINPHRTMLKDQLKISFWKGIKLLACSAISLVLTFLYFKKRPSEGLEVFLDKASLHKMLTGGHVFKSFNPDEDYTSFFFFYTFAVLALYAIISKLVEAKKAGSIKALFKKHDVFLLGTLVMIYLFYTQPDKDGYGAFISIRFALYTFIFLALWISCNAYDKILQTLGILSLGTAFYFFIGAKKAPEVWLNSELKKLDGIEAKIKEGTTVVPVNFADYNWLGMHYSNYIAARKNVIVTENFEASTKYFPLLWKNDKDALNLIAVPKTETECDNFLLNLNNYPGGVDYIFVYGDRPNDPLCNKVLDGIKQNYYLAYIHENVFLYERFKNK